EGSDMRYLAERVASSRIVTLNNASEHRAAVEVGCVYASGADKINAAHLKPNREITECIIACLGDGFPLQRIRDDPKLPTAIVRRRIKAARHERIRYADGLREGFPVHSADCRAIREILRPNPIAFAQWTRAPAHSDRAASESRRDAGKFLGR